MRKIFLLFSLTFIFLCYYAQKEIIILHVNDMHGKIDKFPYLSSMIKEIRMKNKNVILLSAGDIFSGNPIVDKYSEKGFPMIDIMNMLPFTLSTLGNHEFDFGGKILAKRLSELKHKVIVANIVKYPEYFPKLSPYEVIKLDGVKIAILGLTQVSLNGYPDTHPDAVKDFEFEDGIITAKKYLAKLKKYPVKIVLSHMGYEKDSLLALACPEINVIIGGHSHKKIQPIKFINGVGIVQAENYLKYLGVLKLALYKNKITLISDTLLPISTNISTDTAILSKVNFYNNNEEFKKIVGYAIDTIKGLQELGCFMTDAYKKVLKTDFALQNSGGIRISYLNAGNITAKQIYELDPFSNDLLICKLKPESIRQIIQYGFYKEGTLDIFSAGFYSKVYIDSDSKITKIDLFDNNGNPLIENHFYTVAIGSYLYSAYNFNKDENFVKSGLTTTDAIFQYLSRIKGIIYKNCKSTELIKEQ